MSEDRELTFKSKIEINPEKGRKMSSDELSFWREMARMIEEMGDEAPMDFADLFLSAHQAGANNLREYIQKGKKRGEATKFELELEKRADEARKKWCEEHNRNPDDWTPSLMETNTENFKSLFKIEII